MYNKCICIYYIHIYICNQEDNVSFQFSPQWFSGDSCCTWSHHLRKHDNCKSCAQAHELPQNPCGEKLGGGEEAR